ncbi:MAG: YsnF/AvaK domain-containing protein [Acetobacteraceae bacterium]|nr:YsnF/AvaK domain-containing protein [Acetobacteraceae bacterium]
MTEKPDPENIVPVAEESVEIGKRRVERDYALIRKTVAHRDEDVEIPLNQEELSIERIPVARVVAAMPVPREENGTLIVPVVEERLVITKQIFLVEELHVCRVRKQQIARQTVRLRREEVHIEHPPTHEPPFKGE